MKKSEIKDSYGKTVGYMSESPSFLDDSRQEIYDSFGNKIGETTTEILDSDKRIIKDNYGTVVGTTESSLFSKEERIIRDRDGHRVGNVKSKNRSGSSKGNANNASAIPFFIFAILLLVSLFSFKLSFSMIHNYFIDIETYIGDIFVIYIIPGIVLLVAFTVEFIGAKEQTKHPKQSVAKLFVWTLIGYAISSFVGCFIWEKNWYKILTGLLGPFIYIGPFTIIMGPVLLLFSLILIIRIHMLNNYDKR